jgi:hypothetical protein
MRGIPSAAARRAGLATAPGGCQDDGVTQFTLVRPAAICIVLLAAGTSFAAQLQPQTVQAFERYARTVEAQIDARLHSDRFLWAEDSPERLKLVRQGQIVAEPLVGKGDVGVPDGLVHDWMGAVFVPGATLAQTLAAVQDYDRNKYTRRPEVLDSRLLSRNGNDFRIYLRLMKKKVLTVVLNTQHEVRYYPLDATRCHSRSYSTRIAEVRSPGQSDERELPEGQGHGFLWRLYSYWRFEERDGGVYIECQALSLSRDIPTGLGWLIEPIIRELPRESLIQTLRSTRNAILNPPPAP